jgi:ABC-type branched-subunit amino acid transport system substrate-binding protein
MKLAAKRWEQEINWRTVTSYDATQAFATALSLSKIKERGDILRQLQSPSFSISKKETSGYGLKWDRSDRSNKNRKYCVVQIKDGKFKDVEAVGSRIDREHD